MFPHDLDTRITISNSEFPLGFKMASIFKNGAWIQTLKFLILCYWPQFGVVSYHLDPRNTNLKVEIPLGFNLAAFFSKWRIFLKRKCHLKIAYCPKMNTLCYWHCDWWRLPYNLNHGDHELWDHESDLKVNMKQYFYYEKETKSIF